MQEIMQLQLELLQVGNQIGILDHLDLLPHQIIGEILQIHLTQVDFLSQIQCQNQSLSLKLSQCHNLKLNQIHSH